MSTDVSIPLYNELLWPTLRAVREIGDSGTIEEIVEKVIELESFSEAQQAIPHGDGPKSELDYRVAWARSYLKGMGALINSKRGVWSTTELGREMTPEDVVARHAAYVAQLREARKQRKAAEPDRDGNLAGQAPEDSGPRPGKTNSSKRCSRFRRTASSD
jgi:restriction system protein